MNTTATPGKQSHDTIAATIELLAETYPRCFFIFEQRRRPLKVGIHHDILAALDGAITPRELGIALRFCTGNTAYLRATLKGAWRIGLDGEPAGTVTEGEEQHARERLAARAAKHIARSAKLVGASTEYMPKPKPSQPKRLSLADLKAAAMERRKQQTIQAPLRLREER